MGRLSLHRFAQMGSATASLDPRHDSELAQLVQRRNRSANMENSKEDLGGLHLRCSLQVGSAPSQLHQSEGRSANNPRISMAKEQHHLDNHRRLDSATDSMDWRSEGER